MTDKPDNAALSRINELVADTHNPSPDMLVSGNDELVQLGKLLGSIDRQGDKLLTGEDAAEQRESSALMAFPH